MIAAPAGVGKRSGEADGRLPEPHRELVLKRMLEDPHFTVRQMVVELLLLRKASERTMDIAWQTMISP